jgi:phytoene/squalene synthetase
MPLAVQKSLFRSARQLLLRSSAFTYLISLLLPRKERPFFWVWYSYLRWVDDTVDAVAQSRRKGCDFLDRQLELLWDLYGARTRDLCNEEQFLAALVAYDLGKGGRLQQPLSEMLAAIKFDIQAGAYWPNTTRFMRILNAKYRAISSRLLTFVPSR